MSISMTCPKCNGKLRVADKLAGKKIKCPKCDALLPVAVPEQAAITTEAPPPASEGIATALPSHEEIDGEKPLKRRKTAQHPP